MIPASSSRLPMAVVAGGGADRMASDAVGRCAAVAWWLSLASLRRPLSLSRGGPGAPARTRAAISAAERKLAGLGTDAWSPVRLARPCRAFLCLVRKLQPAKRTL